MKLNKKPPILLPVQPDTGTGTRYQQCCGAGSGTFWPDPDPTIKSHT